MDARFSKMMAEIGEIARKVEGIDLQIIKNSKDHDMDLESVRQQLMTVINTKAEFRDLDTINQKLHAKGDMEKLQNMIAEIRQEVSMNVNKSMKEQNSFSKKKEEDLNLLKNDFESVQIKYNKDMSNMQDKLQRLAAQFDKELMARDKQIRQFKNMSQEDIQKGFQLINADMEETRKQIIELEARKAEKRDLLDQK